MMTYVGIPKMVECPECGTWYGGEHVCAPKQRDDLVRVREAVERLDDRVAGMVSQLEDILDLMVRRWDR